MIEFCKSGWTDRESIWRADSCEPICMVDGNSETPREWALFGEAMWPFASYFGHLFCYVRCCIQELPGARGWFNRGMDSTGGGQIPGGSAGGRGGGSWQSKNRQPRQEEGQVAETSHQVPYLSVICWVSRLEVVPKLVLSLLYKQYRQDK